MARVTLQDLTKDFPPQKKGQLPFHAVKGIDLQIRDREFLVLVGPSGCGKSTILRMIAGLEEPSKGDVIVAGRDMADVLPKDRNIAMVFQNYSLYPHMTVYDNMAFGLKLRGKGSKQIEKQVTDVAKLLEIEDFLENKPKTLSGGQRQRVALGRAIVRNPRVFLFDEPLSNLDAKMRVSMRTMISKLHARLGSTMIYVTHDQVEAMTMGDRICVMNHGELIQVDTPLNIYNNPNSMFVASFIGSPQINFLHGHIIDEGGSLYFVENNLQNTPCKLRICKEMISLLREWTEKNIVLGIRPECVHHTLTMHVPNNEQVVQATIEIVEPMGAETHLYLESGAHSITAKVPSSAHYRMNEEISLFFDMEKAIFFDPTTEMRIQG